MIVTPVHLSGARCGDRVLLLGEEIGMIVSGELDWDESFVYDVWMEMAGNWLIADPGEYLRDDFVGFNQRTPETVLLGLHFGGQLTERLTDAVVDRLHSVSSVYCSSDCLLHVLLAERANDPSFYHVQETLNLPELQGCNDIPLALGSESLTKITFDHPYVYLSWDTEKKRHVRRLRADCFWRIARTVYNRPDGALSDLHLEMDIPKWRVETVVKMLLLMGALERRKRDDYRKHPRFQAIVTAIYDASYVDLP